MEANGVPARVLYPCLAQGVNTRFLEDLTMKEIREIRAALAWVWVPLRVV